MMGHSMTPEQLSSIAELNVALNRAVACGVVDLMDTEHKATIMDFLGAAGWLIDSLEGVLRVTKGYQGCSCTFNQWLLGVASNQSHRLHCEARAYIAAGGSTENPIMRK